VIVLDTSGVLALVSTRDEHHAAAVDAVAHGHRSTVVPAGILSEIASMVDRRVDPRATLAFLSGVLTAETLLDCGDADLVRIVELMHRYRDRRLGFADACVVACAERNGGDVLAFDRHDLEVVARDVPITLLP
jgi:predicted nucleic acid-binding protein